MDLYKDQLKKPHTSIVQCDFDGYFNQQVRELEGSAEQNTQRAPQLTPDDFTPPSSSGNAVDEPAPPIPGLINSMSGAAPSPGPLRLTHAFFLDQHRVPNIPGSSTELTPIPTPDNSRPTTPLASHLLSAKLGPKGGSRRARKTVASANASSGDEMSRNKSKPAKNATKKMRRWDVDGMADEDDGVILDYSAASANSNETTNPDFDSRASVGAINPESFGIRTGKGQFVLKDLDDEVHSILQESSEKKSPSSSVGSGVVGSSLGAITGLFRNVIGGKVLTKEDLDKSMKGMEEHLLKKNVAREAAVRLCEGVERELVGVKTASFESMLLPFLTLVRS